MADELDQMEQKAAAIDAANNPATEATEQAQPVGSNDNGLLSRELAMFFQVVLPMVTPAFPSLKDIYTPDVVSGVCDAAAAVCVKHGWFKDGIGGKYAEEIALGAIILPLGFATYQGVTADIVRLKAAKAVKVDTAE